MNDKPVISNDYEIIPRKTDSCYLLPRRDWNRIKKGIDKFSEGTDWWVVSLTSTITISVTLWAILFFGGNETKNYEWLFLGALVSTITTIVIFFSMKTIKKKDFSTKKKLQDDIKDIEDAFDLDDIEQKKPATKIERKLIKKQTFTKTEEKQGLNYISLDLSSGLLNSATFEFTSSSKYWRTGFKLMKPNASSEITTLGLNTALFHLTRTEDKVGIDIYPDGKPESHFQKFVEGIDFTKPINITIDRNENNFVNLYINDVVQYNKQFDSELFKKAAILVWGDNNEYDITMDKIKYEYS